MSNFFSGWLVLIAGTSNFLYPFPIFPSRDCMMLKEVEAQLLSNSLFSTGLQFSSLALCIALVSDLMIIWTLVFPCNFHDISVFYFFFSSTLIILRE